MQTHFIKFFILFIISIVMLYFANSKVVIAIAYFVLILSVYFMLSAYIMKQKGY